MEGSVQQRNICSNKHSATKGISKGGFFFLSLTSRDSNRAVRKPFSRGFIISEDFEQHVIWSALLHYMTHYIPSTESVGFTEAPMRTVKAFIRRTCQSNIMLAWVALLGMSFFPLMW